VNWRFLTSSTFKTRHFGLLTPIFQLPPVASRLQIQLYRHDGGGRTERMLWTIVVVLLVLWLLGFSMKVGGGLIHALLVIALIVVVYNLLTGRRTV